MVVNAFYTRLEDVPVQCDDDAVQWHLAKPQHRQEILEQPMENAEVKACRLLLRHLEAYLQLFRKFPVYEQKA